jgi:sugar O-acyltransferase (sialic acid O-acetyltransferase NeuD family)
MRLLVIGAGGHAKVVIDSARAASIDVVGVIGDPQGRTDLLGVPIAATADSIEADAFIIAVGDNRTRSERFSEYLETGLEAATVIHPSAVIAEGVKVGRGTFIAPRVVINVDASIGENCILNTACAIDHDCIIEDHVHIGPMSGLCGAVRIGTGTLVGVGSSIIPMRTFGSWTVVGAGSTVVTDIPADDLYAGVPARPIRPHEE